MYPRRPIVTYAVTIIVVMPDVTLPLAEIKKRLSEIVDGVEQKHDRVRANCNGRPAAVILSPDDLESLEETPGNPVQSQRHAGDPRGGILRSTRGDVVTADQLRAKYPTR